MKQFIIIIFILFLSGCGTYIGSEGVKYNSGQLTGMRTVKTDTALKETITKKIKKAYDDGLEKNKIDVDEIVSKIKIPDNSTTLVSKAGLKQMFGSVVDLGTKNSGGIAYIIMLIVGFIKTRKERLQNGQVL